MKLHLTLILLLICFVLIGCGGGQTVSPTSPTIAPPTEAPAEPTSVPTLPPEITETPLPAQIPTPDPNTPLSEEGPWWVFSREDVLWIVNPDGSGLRKLTEGQDIITRLGDGLALQGGHLAYITGNERVYGLTLNLLSLPSGETRVITPLTSPETEPDIENPTFDESFEAASAVTFQKSIDWAPDGKQLAFLGVMEGPTSDLYTYSIDDEVITQLSDGPTQAIRPLWDPIGKYILHAGVSTMGSGAGLGMEGFWAASADGSGFNSLFEPSEISGDEIVVGWNAPDTFVMFTWSQMGNRDLRSVNVETGESQVHFQGCFNEEMAMDESTGIVLLAISEYGANCIDGLLQGLYLVPTDGGPFLRIVEDDASYILWSDEAGLFLALTKNGVLAVAPSGDFIDLNVPEGTSWFPEVASGTKQLAWTGDSGVWIGPLLGSIDQPPQQIFTEETWTAAWASEGEHLLFITAEGSLYVAHSPDFTPVLVAEGVTSGGADSAWVWP
ncbi:MAG: hypothetical protein GTO18_22150 [Anaerolineales bacterium]|nr:hypothetical protein [Anaerolineales bacterium]